MTVNELYKHLDKLIPRALSCEWDNDGLMCCPDGEREVKKVLVCLDVTAEVTSYAIEEGFDVIVSHHPFIFKGLKSLDEVNYVPRKAMKFIRAGISVMSFHTRLDAMEGGVNDTLASLFGLKNVEPFGLQGEMIGRIGEIETETELCDFAKTVKEKLGAPVLLCADAGKKVNKVAVLGGSGDDFLCMAIAFGADTYVSGDIGYHSKTDAPDMGINIIEAGHFYTEDPICDKLCSMITELGIKAVKYNSNRTFAV